MAQDNAKYIGVKRIIPPPSPFSPNLFFLAPVPPLFHLQTKSKSARQDDNHRLLSKQRWDPTFDLLKQWRVHNSYTGAPFNNLLFNNFLWIFLSLQFYFLKLRLRSNKGSKGREKKINEIVILQVGCLIFIHLAE